MDQARPGSCCVSENAWFCLVSSVITGKKQICFSVSRVGLDG